jgi:hypothetical protein
MTVRYRLNSAKSSDTQEKRFELKTDFALWGGESILGPLGTSATEWPIVPAPGDCDDGEFGGMKIGRGNRSTQRKPTPAPLCPPQIPLDQTRAAAVGSQQLTSRPTKD